jgi:hypothetical protein
LRGSASSGSLTRLDRCSACRVAETGLNAQGICMVGSTDASNSRLARVGRIDRSSREATSLMHAVRFSSPTRERLPRISLRELSLDSVIIHGCNSHACESLRGTSHTYYTELQSARTWATDGLRPAVHMCCCVVVLVVWAAGGADRSDKASERSGGPGPGRRLTCRTRRPPSQGTAQMAAEISFKPWFIPLERSASGLIRIRKSCGS